MNRRDFCSTLTGAALAGCGAGAAQVATPGPSAPPVPLQPNVVAFGAGSYVLTSPMVLAGPASLTGSGSGMTELIWNGPGAAIQVSGSDDSPVRVTGVTIRCSDPASVGIYCPGNLRRSQFSDILITNAGTGVMLLGNAALGGVYYNTFHNVGASRCQFGFVLTSLDGPTAGNRANANLFTQCYAQFCSSNGFLISYGNGNTFIGCSAEQNAGYGFNFLSVQGNAILGGYVEGNGMGNFSPVALPMAQGVWDADRTALV